MAIRFFLLFISILIGPSVVIFTNYVQQHYTGRSYNYVGDLGGLFWESTVISTPFLILSFLGIKEIVPWLVGLLLTAGFWGFVLYDTISNSGTGRGANIGLGLAYYMSPVLISLVCLIVVALSQKRPKSQGRDT